MRRHNEREALVLCRTYIDSPLYLRDHGKWWVLRRFNACGAFIMKQYLTYYSQGKFDQSRS